MRYPDFGEIDAIIGSVTHPVETGLLPSHLRRATPHLDVSARLGLNVEAWLPTGHTCPSEQLFADLHVCHSGD